MRERTGDEREREREGGEMSVATSIHVSDRVCVCVCVCVYVCSYGDMRVAMNALMVAKWKSLGLYQARYVPVMVGPFLKVSLVPHQSKQQHDWSRTCAIHLPHCSHT